MEILQQIFELCVIPLLGILTTYLVKLIRKKNKELDEKVSKEVSRKYIDMLADTITDCVVSTNQTYVDALKEANAFDKEAQKKAFELTYNKIMNVLTEDAKEYLTTIYGDLEIYITTKIESEVKLYKEAGKK